MTVVGISQTMYKIGDLGHVTQVDNPSVEEGDCRYMAKELLAEDYSSLTKVNSSRLRLTSPAALFFRASYSTNTKGVAIF